MNDSSKPEIRTFFLGSGKVIRMASTDVYATDWLTKEFDFAKSTVDNLRKKGLRSVRIGAGFVTGRSFFDFIDHNPGCDEEDE